MKVTITVPIQHGQDLRKDVADALDQLHDCMTDPMFPVAEHIVLTNFDGTRVIGQAHIEFEE